MTTMLGQYLRQFAAWGTALRAKYASDALFRTTLYISALQGALVLLILGIAGLAFEFPTSRPFAVTAIIVGAVGFSGALVRLALQPLRVSLKLQKLFISNIAHELRTPLSTIKTSTEVALLEDRLSPSAREVMRSIVVELDRISEIINNLLSLNTLTRPERMSFANTDLGPIIDEVVAAHGPLARERGISMFVKKDEYRTVWGNPVALEQVITNLLRNALNYTPKNQNGSVTLSARPDYHGSVVLSVHDTGIGISQEDLFHIFEPFYRADTSRTRNIKKGGSGLGLAIVNEIVRAHRGRIHIESAKRKGTTVSVFLPSGHSTEVPGTQARSDRSEISVDFSRDHPVAGSEIAPR